LKFFFLFFFFFFPSILVSQEIFLFPARADFGEFDGLSSNGIIRTGKTGTD